MAREGVEHLSGAASVTRVSFASAGPDQKGWFSRLGTRKSGPSLQSFFDDIGYRGRPELFSMFSCLFGSMQVSPAWLDHHATQCMAYSKDYRSQHGIDPVPARVVAAILARSN